MILKNELMNKLKPRIYLPIETKRRELNARVFFATRAIKKNWSVIICSKQDFYSKYKLLQPGVVFLKSLQGPYIEIIELLKRNNFNFVATNEEGLFFFHDDFIRNKVNQKCIENIDLFFCWGEIEKNNMIRLFNNIKSKLILSGNSRIDILKKENRDYLKDEANQISKKYGKFILFNTRFGRANFIPRFGKNSWLEGQFANGNVNEENKDYLNLVKKSITHEENNFKIFFDFLRIFNKKFPNKKLIIRPHPSENHEIYKLKTKKYKNIFVINDDKNTNSWILASEFLIHCNCTTSVEAFLLKKKSINFMCFKDNEVEHLLPKILSENVYSIDDLINKINNGLNKIDIDKDTYEIIKKWLFNFDENSSSNIILKSLSYLDSSKNVIKDKNVSSSYFLYYKLRRIIRNLILKFFKVGDSGYNQLVRQKMNFFTKGEIKKLCKSYIRDEEYEKISIKELYPDMFEISYD
tara:strand:+ start:2735 stop:4132 length:1398 start_codon:yes stop_codon:yes gene_type:complete